MKRSSTFALAALVGLTTAVAQAPSAQAASSMFTEAAVEQDQFVVMAAPRNSTDYNLVVVEQKSSQRDCWTESNGIVDPLLLNFDFSGICGRATDSNGYSLRMAGEDLGLHYSLRLVDRGNHVALLATPNRRNQSVLEIGRTQTAGQDYLAVTLNPGWSLSRRVYDGKALGHLYFTNQQALADNIAAQPTYQPSVQPAVDSVAVAPNPTPSAPTQPEVVQPETISTGTTLPPAPVVPSREPETTEMAVELPVELPPVIVSPTTSQVESPSSEETMAIPSPSDNSPNINILAQTPHYQELDALYQEMLNRPVDKQGLETYSKKLDNGRSLAWVREQLSDSPEGRKVALNALYREVLGRDVDPSGARVYGKRLQKGWTLTQVRNDLIASDEAQQRLANR